MTQTQTETNLMAKCFKKHVETSYAGCTGKEKTCKDHAMLARSSTVQWATRDRAGLWTATKQTQDIQIHIISIILLTESTSNSMSMAITSRKRLLISSTVVKRLCDVPSPILPNTWWKSHTCCTARFQQNETPEEKQTVLHFGRNHWTSTWGSQYWHCQTNIIAGTRWTCYKTINLEINKW